MVGFYTNIHCGSDNIFYIFLYSVGFNDLKAELTNYLKEFADQGKVVKTEDINKFFDDMQARKRQRVGEAGTAVQYHCR